MPKPNQLKCRPEQFSGLWICEPTALEAYETSVVHIIDSGQLSVVAQESNGYDDADDKGYTVDASGIAHIPIEGMLTKYPTSFRSRLGGTSTVLLQRIFKTAAADASVRGILVECDSPGGIYNGTEELADVISTASAIKPVHFHVHGNGASGMYWLAAHGNYISMDPSAAVGSIGSKVTMKDTSEVYRRAGVKPIHLASGEEKLDGAPGVEVSAATIARVQASVNSLGARFVSIVGDKRRLNGDQRIAIARAGMFDRDQAVKMGLVDSVGFTDHALSTLKTAINNSSGKRGRSGELQPQPAAYNRRANMLTDTQLAQAKLLPGCSAITADNADSALLQVATSLQNALSNEGQRVTLMTTELAQLRASVASELPATKRELAMAAANARALLEPLGGKKLTPACSTELATILIGTDAQLNTVALVPDASGNTLASRVLKVLASNDMKLMPGTDGQKTNAQPVPLNAQGNAGVGDYTLEQINGIRRRAGLDHVASTDITRK